MRLSALLLGCILFCSPLAAQQKKANLPIKDYHFTTVKENPVTSIKNQYRSGTCWCFSALSFLESEAIKAKNLLLGPFLPGVRGHQGQEPDRPEYLAGPVRNVRGALCLS